MTLLELFKKVDPSVLAAKMIFKHLQGLYPVLKISDIADTSSGGTPSRGMIEYYNGDIPWVKSGELKDGLITNCDEYITAAGLKNSSAKLFPKGTLLVAMYGANIGKTGVLDFDATTNQAVCAIFPRVEISKDFLFWYFKQQRIDFIAIGKGGAQPNISQTVINNASIIVPDEKIQKLIVDFLERIEQGNVIDEKFFIPEVLEDVERIYKYKNCYVDLSESFENQLTQIENLNQAILQEAVQGKLLSEAELTELKNEQDYEPANILLKRIKSEKAKSGKKEKPLPPIKPAEIPFEIPESWVWCRLGEICEEIIDCPHSTPKYLSTETGYYGIDTNCIDNSGNITRLRHLSKEGYEERIKRIVPFQNDIIYAREGSIGLAAFIPKEKNICLGQRVMLFRSSHGIIPSFLKMIVTEETYKKRLLEKHRGMGAKHVNVKDIIFSLISLPPLSEQTRIVAEIEKQLAKTKQIRQHIIASQQATEQLLKALLHGAFEVEESPDPVGKV